MLQRESIKKINVALRHGDQARIADMSGISKVTVNRFFNGNEDCISDEKAAIIIEKAAIIIKERSKTRSKSEKKLAAIINAL
jgi:ABC-type phosphate/phosphonate transport system ATPase subunit